jgi:hypothetical protein
MSTTRSDQKKSVEAEAAFKSAVDDFERSLLRPLLSGELPNWVKEVHQDWREAASHIHYQIKHQHPRQYEEIAQQDPELLPRIDLLKREDAAIEVERETINQAVDRVAEHLPKLEPDEGKAEKFTKPLIDDGMAFIARVRKQVIAVQTWYIEAFNRDRGAVD